MPRPNPLASAAALRSSPARSNFDQYAPVFAEPSEGHVPSAWEQATGNHAMDEAATELGGGPAIQALRHAADALRLEHSNDLAASDADFLAHGRDRAMAHARVENEVGDVMGEAGARRGFLPWESAAKERDAAAQLARLQMQYASGPAITGQAHVAGAQAEAEGRVKAAQAARAPLDPLEALRQAVLKRFQGGFPVDDQEVARLQAEISGMKK